MENINTVNKNTRAKFLTLISDSLYSNASNYEALSIEVLRTIQETATIDQLVALYFYVRELKNWQFIGIDTGNPSNTLFIESNNMTIGIEADGYIHS